MAKNQPTRPNTDNRAQMVTQGQMEAPKPFNPQDLADSAVAGNPPPFAISGNPEMEDLSREPQDQTPPAGQPVQPDPQPQAQTPAPAPQIAAIPDEVDDPRFVGKSKKDVYESYRNLERLQAEKAEENKVYRTLYEQQVLKPQMEAAQQRAQAPAPAPSSPTAVLNEMLTDPTAYGKRLKTEAKQELFDELVQAGTVNEARQEWMKHQDLFRTPEFAAWEQQNLTPAMIQASTTDARTTRLIVNAFRSSQPQPQAPGVQAQALAPQPQPPVPAAPGPDRRIPVGTARGAPASARSEAAPTFTVAKLARMQLENPDEYARRQPEIMAWYLEQGNKRR